MTIEQVINKFMGVKKSANDSYTAICPRHGDTTPSLSISEKDGKILMRCHGGCETKDVLESVGLSMKDLFHDNGDFPTKAPRKGSNGNGKSNKPVERKPQIDVQSEIEKALTLVAVYNYTDESGNLLFQTCRYTDPQGHKTFRQRRQDPSRPDKWLYNLGDTPRVLYNLPGVIQAIKESMTVIVVEGEKDADRLIKGGYPGTTTAPMGAQNWNPDYAKSLVGAYVVIIPDHDEPGKKYANAILNSIKGKAAGVKLVNIPGFPCNGKKDISDWLDEKHTTSEFEALVNDTPDYDYDETPVTTTDGIYGSEDEDISDIGNAHRFARIMEGNLRFVQRWGMWYQWNGYKWQEDERGQIIEWASMVSRDLKIEYSMTTNEDKQKELVKMANQCRNMPRIKALLEAAKGVMGSIPGDYDNNPDIIPGINFAYDIKTWEVIKPDRDYMNTKIVGTNYNPDMTCPNWLHFLDTIFRGDQGVIDFVQIAVGYSMTGYTSDQSFFILYGDGSNGKSTFVTTIARMLGDYAHKIPTSAIYAQKFDGIPCDIAALKGKRFVFASEGQKNRRLNEALIKELTGGEPITARFLNQNPFTYMPELKLWLCTNHKPLIRDESNGMWRRIRLIEFGYNYDDHPDEKLPEHAVTAMFNKELPGIFNWARVGLRKWKDGLFIIPDSVRASTEKYREQSDVFADYFSQIYDVDFAHNPDDKHKGTPSQVLFTAYRDLAHANADKYPLNMNNFSIKLESMGFERYQESTGDRRRMFRGIQIHKDYTPPPSTPVQGILHLGNDRDLDDTD